MALSFVKRWWQPKSLRRTIRRPRLMRVGLEHLEDRLVPSLAINPIFDNSITNDPNAATIERTINTAIQNIESSFSNPITVTIKFQVGNGPPGSSSVWGFDVSYASFRASLAAAATTQNAQTAVASLPTSIDNPVNGNPNVHIFDSEARALGYIGANPPAGMPDGTITLNTSICNLDRSSINPTKYDLLAVTSHEIDEVLGFSSALNGSSNGAPAPTGSVSVDDLWRYDQNGARSFNTTLANQAYFSIDGGQTDLARFNQQAGGDFSDWYSPGGQKPQVQDAFGTPGATPNLGVELIRLNVDGYTPAPLAAPAGLTATPVSSSQINLSWNSVPGATSYTLEWSTDGQNWNSLPGTTATSYSATGLAAGTTYYFRIQASNMLVSSPWSAPVSATTAPATPTGVRATAVSSSEIDLTWNSVPGASSYTVERSLVNDLNTSDSNWQVLGTTSGTTWADSGLQSGTTYYYSILASNPTGSSPWSAPANATTTPAAPMGLTATALPPSQINLTWNAVTGATGGYVIERSSNGNSGWTPIGTTAAGVTTFSDTGLAANTTYYYEVSAVDAGGDSPFSAIVSASTALATPTLTAQGSGSSINLYWNSVTGASNYTVERSLDGQSWSVLTTLGSNYVGYSDTGLAGGTTYYYRVQASNAAESSPWSAPASATTAPATPTGVRATAVSSSEIDLTWNSVPGASSYTVERSLDDTNWFVRATTSGTTYADSGLQGNTVYYYRISAGNATGSSSYSAPVSALTAPASPTGLTATAVSNYQVNLSWNSDPGAANYTLERSLDDSSWQVLGSTTATSYSDTGLQAGTTYYYRIQASNVIGASPYSTPVSVGTSAVAPGTPTGLAAIVFANNQIVLSWNSEPNALNYYLERSLDGKNWQLIAALGNQTSYNDTGLQSGTTYYYSVWASNTIGSSSASAPISAITFPATPTGLTATPGATAVWITNANINLHWNSDPGATSYMLMRSSVNDPNPYDSNWKYVATVSGTSYTDTYLNSASTYYYSILAMNAAGYQQSSFCTPVSGVSSMTSDEHFVHALYQDFLKRPGSKSEWDGWVLQMSHTESLLWLQGYTTAQAQTQAQFAVANSIVHSQEYYTDLVNGMYSHYLGRPADAQGFNVWYSALANGQTFEQVLSQFLASPEFYNRSGGNNTAFVQTLYVDLLNRPADAGGLAAWVNALNSGASRQSVVSVFVTCSEFRTYVVEALYGKGESYWFVPNMLNRYADSAGLTSWVNYWNNSGTNLLTMDANFAATSEFYADAQNM